jgi:hypothetical protein
VNRRNFGKLMVAFTLDIQVGARGGVAESIHGLSNASVVPSAEISGETAEPLLNGDRKQLFIDRWIVQRRTKSCLL